MKRTNIQGKNIIEDFIIYTITILIIFIQSLFVLGSVIWKGYKKRVVLTKKAKTGFDFDIIIRGRE